MSEEVKQTEEVVKVTEGEEEGEGTPVVVTTKKQTWLNRICSAVAGAVVAVGAMFGITKPQIDAEKAKVATLQTSVKEAVDALQKGDVKTATDKLQAASKLGQEVVTDVKTKVNEVKNADKKEVVKTATEAAKTEAKKTETTPAAPTTPATK